MAEGEDAAAIEETGWVAEEEETAATGTEEVIEEAIEEVSAEAVAVETTMTGLDNVLVTAMAVVAVAVVATEAATEAAMVGVTEAAAAAAVAVMNLGVGRQGHPLPLGEVVVSETAMEAEAVVAWA